MALDTGLRILSTTIGEIGTIGLSCLMALHIAGRHVSEDDLMATVHVDSLSTLRRHLNSCAAHDYASMVKRSRAAAALWHITDIGKSIVIRVISLLGLPAASTTGAPRLITAGDEALDIAGEKKYFSALSSSSSDPDQSSGSDLIDQIEEEEDGVEFKKFLCREFGLTGDRARQIIAVCCGDWTRVLGPSATFAQGMTSILLDPPYSSEAGRDNGLYGVENDSIAHDVREWAIANGDNPLLRIALCGYEAEHDHAMPDTWEVYRWKAAGGYGSQGNGTGRENAIRETIWFSPACLKPEMQLALEW